MGRNSRVDAYIERSEKWPEEMTALRAMLLDCGLTEGFKWWIRCYSHGGKGVRDR